MSSFVLPLPGVDGSISAEPKRYSLDNLDDLIDHISSSEIVQQSLEIDYTVGYGVWETIDKNYIVAAELNTSWGDLLNLPYLDDHLTWTTCTWQPPEEQRVVMRKHIALQLASIIQGATGDRLDASRLRYSIRRRTSQGAKIYSCYITQ